MTIYSILSVQGSTKYSGVFIEILWKIVVDQMFVVIGVRSFFLFFLAARYFAL